MGEKTDWDENSTNMETFSAKELCIKVQQACDEFNANNVTSDNMDKFPWKSNMSDHLPQYFNLSNGVNISCMNCLNPRYEKWLYKPEDDAIDNTQRLSYLFPKDEQAKILRTKSIAVSVRDLVKLGNVVCLQEVWPELLEQIHEHKEELALSVIKQNNGQGNYNVVLFDLLQYNQVITTGVKITDAGVHEDRLDMQTMVHLKSGFQFDVINVHVEFGKNRKYAEALLATQRSRAIPLFVCGDFNASSRWPRLENECDHIAEIYDAPVFRFAFSAPGYSHVNTFNNAKSSYNQIDKFDYIMIMGWEHLPALQKA